MTSSFTIQLPVALKDKVAYATAEIDSGRILYVLCQGDGKDSQRAALLAAECVSEYCRQHPGMESTDLIYGASGYVRHRFVEDAYYGGCALVASVVLAILDHASEKAYIAHLGICRAKHISPEGETLYKSKTNHGRFSAPRDVSPFEPIAVESPRGINANDTILLSSERVTPETRTEDSECAFLSIKINK